MSPPPLRVAVAGLPKAGVSTLVNALIGAAVLPVSTLEGVSPLTEVAVVPAGETVAEPTLHLSDGTRAAVRESPGTAEPSRAASAGRLLAGPLAAGAAPVTGADRVRAVLADLRRALGATASADGRGEHPSPPHVVVPVGWAASERFVLVDGPPGILAGPSDAFLVVLDYTHLDTVEDARVLRLAAEATARVGPGRVTIAVNRVDQGEDGDLAGESLRRHVHARMPAAGRPPVVETSARWALAASLLLGDDAHAATLDALAHPMGGGAADAGALSRGAEHTIAASGIPELRQTLLRWWSAAVRAPHGTTR
ncbi:hypothetical protein [Sphaerisporangium sp. TRM90804]|uniref:hypothetical protein n=1 Tax=Sphaerisporangium sp. TRM90804 TaxID=3031113 RepID=UPI00244CE468|nr:hypothetical protein [Sphaerisporangium sp. TRM90804]MDH2429018.1 hypothetical protein [Sphaerisporangium sp. TRM90804]